MRSKPHRLILLCALFGFALLLAVGTATPAAAGSAAPSKAAVGQGSGGSPGPQVLSQALPTLSSVATEGARRESWPPTYFWGYVTDSTDQDTLFGVEVKATQPGTGLVYTTSTDAAGKYRLDLNPDSGIFGEYNVEFSMEGYQTKYYHLWLSLLWTTASGPADGRVDEALTPSAAQTPTVTGFTPTSGSVGTVVTLTGTNFTGATTVTFNGVSASFTVVNATQITATVPSGATTGPIAVTTLAGTGASAASFSVSSSGNDDDIPGVPIPASSFSGSVSTASDLDDVFSIALTAGQTLNASIVGPSESDFRLYLYAPGTVSVKPDGVPYEAVAYRGDSPYPCSFAYPVTHSGTYYLDVYAAAGAGSYTVTYSVTSGGDTVGPVCAAKNVTVRRGTRCKLYFKVYDALSAQVTKKLVIKTKSGRVMARGSWGYNQNVNGWWHIHWRCTLRKGTYRIVVTGKDLAGNRQSVTGRARLTVK